VALERALCGNENLLETNLPRRLKLSLGTMVMLSKSRQNVVQIMKTNMGLFCMLVRYGVYTALSADS
jgi:hypothetical protein